MEDFTTLDVKLTSREQLFSVYSYTDDNLNPEFCQYLLEQAKNKLPLKSKLKIRLHTTTTKITAEEVTPAIANHYRREYQSQKRDARRLNIYAGIMTLFGIIALSILILINHFANNFYLTSIVEIAAWVFIWQAVDLFFLRRPIVRAKSLLSQWLLNATVEICAD